jgi:hypothetical protein
VGQALLWHADFSEAEPFLRLYLEIAAQKLPEGWRRFDVTAALGTSLLGQKKYTEAETALRNGYTGLRQYEESIPLHCREKRLREALESLVRLYEETSKPADATKWRRELAATRSAAKSAGHPR